MLKVVYVLIITQYSIFHQYAPCGSGMEKSEVRRCQAATVKLDWKEKLQFYTRKTSDVEENFRCSY
jgi:hypothetical protein